MPEIHGASADHDSKPEDPEHPPDVGIPGTRCCPGVLGHVRAALPVQYVKGASQRPVMGSRRSSPPIESYREVCPLHQNFPEEEQRRLAADMYALAQNLVLSQVFI